MANSIIQNNYKTGSLSHKPVVANPNPLLIENNVLEAQQMHSIIN